tara:strand:+ start:1890 stop:2405 length:516 start_codon:yes stop_codon:yes gene_type:complete
MGKESEKSIYVFGGKREYYQLKHSGLFNINKILKELKSELKRLKYDIEDKDHSEGVKASGKELLVELKCSREISEYVKFNIGIIIMTLRQVDVMVNKKKMQKGDFEFRFTAKMEKNYEKKNYEKSFKKTKAGEIQRHLYEKFIIPSKLDEGEDKLESEGKKFIDIIKENLY